MKAILLGYGKMGHLLNELLLEEGSEVLAVLDNNTGKKNNKPLVCSSIEELSPYLSNVDIIFDFIGADSKLILKELLSEYKGLRIVSGSTAWNVESVFPLVKKNQHSFLYSANFSLGINIFKSLLNYLLKNTPIQEFDASLLEYHHKNKKDAPSGTAKALKTIFDKNNLELPISSVRQGYYPGIHQIDFDSEFETLSIKHIARDRKVFAKGAIFAAKFLLKQNEGIYTFEDVLRV